MVVETTWQPSSTRTGDVSTFKKIVDNHLNKYDIRPSANVHVNAETTDNGIVHYRSCSNLSVLFTGRGVIAGKYIVVIIFFNYIVIVLVHLL